jgi:hypothetical protein
MKLESVFHRGESCDHNPDRECTPCFRAAVRVALGVEDEQALWVTCGITDSGDIVERLTYFEDYGPAGIIMLERYEGI